MSLVGKHSDQGRIQSKKKNVWKQVWKFPRKNIYFVVTSYFVSFPQFDHPTCNSFRETILDGNLCYEIDPSKFENDRNRKKSKNIGLSLLIDNNEEYDTRKIILDGESKTNHEDFTEGFVRFEERQKLMIHIQTIS